MIQNAKAEADGLKLKLEGWIVWYNAMIYSQQAALYVGHK